MMSDDYLNEANIIHHCFVLLTAYVKNVSDFQDAGDNYFEVLRKAKHNYKDEVLLEEIRASYSKENDFIGTQHALLTQLLELTNSPDAHHILNSHLSIMWRNIVQCTVDLLDALLIDVRRIDLLSKVPDHHLFELIDKFRETDEGDDDEPFYKPWKP